MRRRSVNALTEPRCGLSRVSRPRPRPSDALRKPQTASPCPSRLSAVSANYPASPALLKHPPPLVPNGTYRHRHGQGHGLVFSKSDSPQVTIILGRRDIPPSSSSAQHSLLVPTPASPPSPLLHFSHLAPGAQRCIFTTSYRDCAHCLADLDDSSTYSLATRTPSPLRNQQTEPASHKLRRGRDPFECMTSQS